MTIELYLNSRVLLSYKREENVFLPTIAVGIFTPGFFWGQKQESEFGDNPREVGFQATTELRYHWSNGYKRAQFAVLGFGGFVSYQTDF